MSFVPPHSNTLTLVIDLTIGVRTVSSPTVKEGHVFLTICLNIQEFTYVDVNGAEYVDHVPCEKIKVNKYNPKNKVRTIDSITITIEDEWCNFSFLDYSFLDKNVLLRVAID